MQNKVEFQNRLAVHTLIFSLEIYTDVRTLSDTSEILVQRDRRRPFGEADGTRRHGSPFRRRILRTWEVILDGASGVGRREMVSAACGGCCPRPAEYSFGRPSSRSAWKFPLLGCWYSNVRVVNQWRITDCRN